MSSPAHSGAKRPCPGGSADGRRVQPRHFHLGRNPAPADEDAAAASSSDAADADADADDTVSSDAAVEAHAAADQSAASAAATRSLPASQLYRHALESVFAFLDRGEVMSALRVSKAWRDAVESMAGLQLTFNSPSPVSLVSMAASPMGHHIASLGDKDRPDSVALSEMALFVLARHMAQLRRLHGRLDLSSPLGPKLFLPAALRELSLDVAAPASGAAINAVLKAVGRLEHLQTLNLTLPAIDPLVSFAPLASVPGLRSLNLAWVGDDTVTDAQVDELRALPRLHKVTLSRATTEMLQRLLAQPHALEWKKLSTPYAVDDATAALLSQLPSLTTLKCMVDCTHFNWLQRLPKLMKVAFEFMPDAAPPPGLIDSLVAGLQHCTSVADLHLNRCAGLTAAHLEDLLPRLPRLYSLKLTDLGIDSLSFLEQAPLTGHLLTLTLSGCTRLPLPELRHVHSLRRLISLLLFRSFDERMDSYCQRLLQPPSAVLPQLEVFCYQAPEIEAEGDEAEDDAEAVAEGDDEAEVLDVDAEQAEDPEAAAPADADVDGEAVEEMVVEGEDQEGEEAEAEGEVLEEPEVAMDSDDEGQPFSSEDDHEAEPAAAAPQVDEGEGEADEAQVHEVDEAAPMEMDSDAEVAKIAIEKNKAPEATPEQCAAISERLNAYLDTKQFTSTNELIEAAFGYVTTNYPGTCGMKQIKKMFAPRLGDLISKLIAAELEKEEEEEEAAAVTAETIPRKRKRASTEETPAAEEGDSEGEAAKAAAAATAAGQAAKETNGGAASFNRRGLRKKADVQLAMGEAGRAEAAEETLETAHAAEGDNQEEVGVVDEDWPYPWL